MRRRVIATALATAALVVSTTAAAAGNSWESANVLSQLDPITMTRSVVAVNGASILRNESGVTAHISMPTPEPGTYAYAAGPTGTTEVGHPEAFSYWLFVFFNPEECAAMPCGPGDLINDPDVVAGAFNVGGHLVSGTTLTMAGRANSTTMSFGGANAETIGQALAMGYSLADAEIHVAVAPHGALNPALLPGLISTPNGGPPQWWLAFFL
jgi:hypothetical protein